MTTITLDSPLKFTKTHFTNEAELMYYIAKLQLKKISSKKTTTKNSQYEIAINDLKNGVNTISLSDYMQKRWIIK